MTNKKVTDFDVSAVMLGPDFLAKIGSVGGANQKITFSNFKSGVTFSTLADVTNAFTTPHALYKTNAASNAYEETGITMPDGAANTIEFNKGTTNLNFAGDLNVEATSLINQDLTTDSITARFDHLEIGGTGGSEDIDCFTGGVHVENTFGFKWRDTGGITPATALMTGSDNLEFTNSVGDISFTSVDIDITSANLNVNSTSGDLTVTGDLISSDPGTDGSLVLENAGATESVKLDANGNSWINGGNFAIGTELSGAGAAGVMTFGNGTIGAALANVVQVVSDDLSAGNTTLSVRTEGTSSGTGTGDNTSDGYIAVKWNGTTHYILTKSTTPT